MSKISLDMSLQQILWVISEGNPGALNVVSRMVSEGASVDPDCFDSMMPVLHLDTMGICGSDVWLLYKDVCGENLARMLAVIRGWQLGLVQLSTIKDAMQHRGLGLDVDEVCRQVKSRLPAFKV